MPHTDAQIEDLHVALLALPPQSEGMLASQSDGFVTGMLLCPEMILNSDDLLDVYPYSETGSSVQSAVGATESVDPNSRPG